MCVCVCVFVCFDEIVVDVVCEVFFFFVFVCLCRLLSFSYSLHCFSLNLKVLFWKNSRQCIQLHRVTADNMTRFPLTMKPHTENAVQADDADKQAKKEKSIYQAPGLVSRLHRLFTRLVDFATAGFR